MYAEPLGVGVITASQMAEKDKRIAELEAALRRE